tara:strand:+ start:231 stop:350 length:120 start_codon:yes stop_codon:yes gene_type:complete
LALNKSNLNIKIKIFLSINGSDDEIVEKLKLKTNPILFV